MQSTLSPKTNYWPRSSCAKAFWTQHELPAYQELLAVTVDWMDPHPGERWLDLGCGGGQLTRCLWEKSGGSLAEVVATDCAAANHSQIHLLLHIGARRLPINWPGDNSILGRIESPKKPQQPT